MKTLVSLFTWIALGSCISLTAAAGGIEVRCLETSAESCSWSVLRALSKLNCAVTSQVSCLQAGGDKAFFCRVYTQKCSEPHADMMFTTSCYNDEKLSLSKENSKLTLSWTMGMFPFRYYVDDLCFQIEHEDNY